MAKKFLASLLILIFALAAPFVAQTQPDAGKSPTTVPDWQGLRNVKVGQSLVVYTKNGKEIEGKFADFAGGTLNLTLGFDVISFQPNEIQEVRQKSARKKGRIIGAIVGTLAGAIIGAAAGLKTETPGVESAAPSIMGASAFGAGGIGYAIGLHYDRKRKGKLLYRAP